jgi:hypothetical protein
LSSFADSLKTDPLKFIFKKIGKFCNKNTSFMMNFGVKSLQKESFVTDKKLKFLYEYNMAFYDYEQPPQIANHP